jgi:hypothetical protein
MYSREICENPVMANKHLHKLLKKHNIPYRARVKEGDFLGAYKKCGKELIYTHYDVVYLKDEDIEELKKIIKEESNA